MWAKKIILKQQPLLLQIGEACGYFSAFRHRAALSDQRVGELLTEDRKPF